MERWWCGILQFEGLTTLLFIYGVIRMTKKFICDECGTPCILEVEKGASKPTNCPYNENECPYWREFEGE